jgi:hypothetical protein
MSVSSLKSLMITLNNYNYIIINSLLVCHCASLSVAIKTPFNLEYSFNITGVCSFFLILVLIFAMAASIFSRRITSVSFPNACIF